SEVVDLPRLDLLHHINDRKLVQEIGLVQRDPVREVLDPLEALGARSTNNAMYFVAFVEQEFGEIAAVLAGDASDECFFHVLVPRLRLGTQCPGGSAARQGGLAVRSQAEPGNEIKTPDRSRWP